jgi:HAD superfamily hydrolase (TIGR01509 family)
VVLSNAPDPSPFRPGRRRSSRVFKRAGLIRGLLFDANGVLYSRPRDNMRLNRFLAPLGLAALPDDQTRRALGPERDAARTGRLSLDGYYRAQLRAYGLDDPELMAEGVRLMAEDSADIDLYPGTADALARLKTAGVKLAIVTDSTKPAALKLAWLEARGVSRDVFAAVVSSAEAGCCKPEPEIYHAALAQMGAAPAETAFVGHATDELVGAASIDIATIAFRPDEPDVEADARIDGLGELLELI